VSNPTAKQAILRCWGKARYPQAQQVSQRDAPPGGGFEVLVFIMFGGFVSLSLAARPLP